MRQLRLFLILAAITLSGCNNTGTTNYPDADAVYMNLKKTYILNLDGSIEKQTQKEQKLLTYRSFHSFFGDTRILYNPAFEQLTVPESYTVMADGKKVHTPENGYNEVLPSFSTESEAYNHLREMVVTHTALERGSVINCSYNIVTESGILPFLSGHEVLSATCPIENLQIVVKVPTSTQLHYKLLNLEVKPTIKEGEKFDTYTWQFKDLPQQLHEKLEPNFNTKVPRLMFSTQKDSDQSLEFMTSQGISNQTIDKHTAESVATLVAGKKTVPEKVLQIQRLVVEDINLLPIPQELIAFRVRPAQQTWNSNSGTPMEKAMLMTSLLKAIDVDAEVCLEYPSIFENESSSFLMNATPFVRAITDSQTPMLLSVTHLNTNSSELEKSGYSKLSLSTGSLPRTLDDIKNEIQITGDLSLNEEGDLVTDLHSQYSNAYNPWFKIIRDPSFSDLITGIKGEIKSSSPQKSDIHYKGQNEKWAENRGGYYFVNLPQSNYGIASKGILPLASGRETSLSFGYPLLETYQVTLTVPEGWELINDNLTTEMSFPLGRLSIKIEPSGNKVSIYQQIEVNQPEIDLNNYPGFKDLINTWYLKKYNQLVFRKL